MKVKDAKIIQILQPVNDSVTQGRVIALGDDGVIYISDESGWVVYIPLQFSELNGNKD